MRKTAADLLKTCNTVLDAAAAGKTSVEVNGYTWDLTELGKCQRYARLAYEATTGSAMPGKDETAWRTFLNLRADGWKDDAFCPGWWLAPKQDKASWDNWNALKDKLQPGDFIYLGYNDPGHVVIWMGVHDGEEWCYQNTSRGGMGCTRAGLTDDQKQRVVGVFRLLPLAAEAPAVVKPPAPPVPAPKPAAPAQVWNIAVAPDDGSGDIVAKGMATTFNDHTTRTGVPADRESLIACSLPRGNCAATAGSPFVGVPDGALVRVYCPSTGKLIYAPVIDEGPAWSAQAGTGKPGSAMIDLTPSAFTALGLRDNAMVTIRILRGSDSAFRAARRGHWA